MEYNGGVYVGQVLALNKEDARYEWIKVLNMSAVLNNWEEKDQENLLKEVERESFTAIKGLQNIWLLGLFIKGQYAMVHVVRTDKDVE